jgi:hypothetical protein
MLSKVVLLALAATLSLTAASPTPGQKTSADKRPSGVPYWKTVSGETQNCGDECSYECWNFKKKTLYIQGTRSSSFYSGDNAEVKLGDDLVVPEKYQVCFECNEAAFPGKDNNGWELKLHLKGTPMIGPMPYTLKYPWEVALFSVGDGMPYNSDQVISRADHDCDYSQCMGEYGPRAAIRLEWRVDPFRW